MSDYDAIRPCIERLYTADGARLSDCEWQRICQTVDRAPPLREADMRRITDVLVPVPVSTVTPDAATPSVRTGRAA